jgi:hypothetical protein
MPKSWQFDTGIDLDIERIEICTANLRTLTFSSSSSLGFVLSLHFLVAVVVIVFIACAIPIPRLLTAPAPVCPAKALQVRAAVHFADPVVAVWTCLKVEVQS